MKLREGRTGQKTGLRKRGAVEYNVEKLAVKAFTIPKPKKTIKKKVPKKKGEKKVGTPYLVLIKRAIKALIEKEKRKNKDGKVKSTVSAQSILAYLSKNTPEKSDKRYVKAALVAGVSSKILVKTRNSYRLSSKEAKKQKKTTKKSTTSKKTTKRKSAAKDSKRPTKKAKTTSTTKKATKKVKPTKKPTKKNAPEKVKKVKKSKKTEADEKGTIAEGVGKAVWQYYDNGWHNYEDGASAIVEGVYQEYLLNTTIDVRPVKSGNFQYSVDFTALQQKNTETNTVRNIRRHLEK